MFELREVDVGCVEIFGVGPGAHGSAGLVLGTRGGFLQRFLGNTFEEAQLMLAAFTEHGDFHFLRQRIGHCNAHAVQTTGELVGAAFFLVEFAA